MRIRRRTRFPAPWNGRLRGTIRAGVDPEDLVSAARPLNRGMLRAYTRDDLPPLPEGWRAGPPDFVAVGCGRSGSGWWWELLQEHPQIEKSRLGSKELYYFQHFGWNGPNDDQVALYREAFAAPPGSICGDGSFNYLTHPMAIQHLWRAAPETRLIALVRNPVDRFISTYDRFNRVRMGFLGLEEERAYVQRVYSFWCEAVTHCKIADGVRAVQRRWDRSAVLVLQYEKCVADPAGELARTFRFLEVDDTVVPTDLTRPVNREAHAVASPDEAARQRLIELFSDDVAAVTTMWPEIDRSLWPEF
jgi:hypothetical protein